MSVDQPLDNRQPIDVIVEPEQWYQFASEGFFYEVQQPQKGYEIGDLICDVNGEFYTIQSIRNDGIAFIYNYKHKISVPIYWEKSLPNIRPVESVIAAMLKWGLLNKKNFKSDVELTEEEFNEYVRSFQSK